MTSAVGARAQGELEKTVSSTGAESRGRKASSQAASRPRLTPPLGIAVVDWDVKKQSSAFLFFQSQFFYPSKVLS